MTKSGAAAAYEQSATARQLKVLVVVLVLSNLGLGLFSVYLLRSIERSYTGVIDRSVPVLADLNDITAAVAGAHRLSGPTALLNQPASARPAALEKARSARLRQRQLFEALVERGQLDAASPAVAALRRAHDGFGSRMDELLVLVERGDVAGAGRVRDASLLPAFDDYLSALGRVADEVEGVSQRQSSEATERTERMSRVVLGLAGWPVLVLIALLIVTAVFVLVLMVLFRGREMSDMP